MTLEKKVRENAQLRDSFMALAQETFDLSFAPWYQKGYWTDKYIPYALAEEGRVVANASVNLIHTLRDGVPKRYVQLGTVMTHPEYRGRGLSRRLLEEILRDWETHCDAIYLYANDSVVDFYPKFGFRKETEYQYSLELGAGVATQRHGVATQLLPQAGSYGAKTEAGLRSLKPLRRSLKTLQGYYEKSNPYSALPMLENVGLLMFYCQELLADCCYVWEEGDTVVIGEQEGDTFLCMDIFGDLSPIFPTLPAFLAAIAPTGTRRVRLGFTPKDTTGFQIHPIQEPDTTLFVLQNKENPFSPSQVMLPLLSHA